MATWMKRRFDAEGVTEFPAGPRLAELSQRFRSTGAVVLCVDVSYSMAGEPLREAQRGGEGFIDDATDGGYEVGLVLWGSDVRASAAPAAEVRRARDVLRAAEPEGSTNLNPALEAAEKMLRATGSDDQVCVVFTDGVFGDTRSAVETANRMKAQGIRILTIGLGRAAARGLEGIASDEAPEPREATATSLAHDLRAMATGLTPRKKQ